MKVVIRFMMHVRPTVLGAMNVLSEQTGGASGGDWGDNSLRGSHE